ncbi:polysaccharide deacetylase [Robbsia sp. Bb-Pol-6]|uniref:Polysaccharide deacetylase n=1 Tax=Robbsia betulipollinis TaxID=2981849 RepID=A0ABT3ZS12_9BURK|nr:polysaccharide deacetylase [Robbsia betulipollinis]MCY0389341.1 polysaccharide deacetylase [Robbsia betulipollinis]
MDSVPFFPANRAAPAPLYPWPDNQKSALFLAVDVDAESAWTAKDPKNYERLVTMSYGGYEARVGVPKMLQLFRDLELKATFFITGWAVEAHPAMAEAILRDGHEIGHHGFAHLLPDPGDPMILDEMDRGLDALKRRLGVVPVGYRAPLGESCEQLRVLLKERGFVYSSSWRDDVRPYRQILASGASGVIELPASMSFDDWMFGLTHRFSPRPMFPREHVLSIWNDELEETREWGGLITTILHPQVSGRPIRFKILREFLHTALDYRDVWITTGEKIARHFAECEAGDPTMPPV